jgi:mRNA interferase MazF
MGRGGVAVEVSRFEVYLVNLDPTIGSKIRKIRPCLVVSPDEMNAYIRTVIVAPMTTKGQAYPTRVACRFKGKSGQVVLDQIRTVDKVRLVKKLGRLDRRAANHVLTVLEEMFAR